MSLRVFGSSTTDHPTWISKTAYTFLNFVIPVIPDGKCYECTNPGTSGRDEPTWNSTLGATTVDGDFEQEDPVSWACRELLAPNPLIVDLDTKGHGHGGYALKDLWVKNGGTVDFVVYGSHDGTNWRRIDEITLPHANRDNRHKGLKNAYRYIRVCTDSPTVSEIEIVAGV